MPIYTFVADKETTVPQGYAQRVTIASRQTQNWRDQDGSVKTPEVWAYRLIQAAGVPLLPNWLYVPYLQSKEVPAQDQVLSMQLAQPSVQQQVQVNAPYAEPQGNRGQEVIPLPVMGDKTRYAPAGDLEPLPDAALPTSGGDGLYGEMDGLGGTFSDLDSSGREIPRNRDFRIPVGVPVQQRGGQ